MKNLVLGKSNKKLQLEQNNNTSSHIYFWWLEDVKIKHYNYSFIFIFPNT